MPAKYVPPTFGQASFNCPHCSALAQQVWYNISQYRAKSAVHTFSEVHLKRFKDEMSKLNKDTMATDEEKKEISNLIDEIETALKGRPYLSSILGGERSYHFGNIHASLCFSCREISIWLRDRVIYPIASTADLPHEEMPEHISKDFDEARSIFEHSPKGSAALLRLCIQKLCMEAGEKGKNLNDDIAALVKKGLPEEVQQALDVVRIVGNNSVHPGQIEDTDTREMAQSLFSAVNLVCEELLARKKRIKRIYEQIPKNQLAQIAKRDGSTSKK